MRSFKAVPPSNRCNEFWVEPGWASDFASLHRLASHLKLRMLLAECHLWKLRNQIKIAHNREPSQCGKTSCFSHGKITMALPKTLSCHYQTPWDLCWESRSNRIASNLCLSACFLLSSRFASQWEVPLVQKTYWSKPRDKMCTGYRQKYCRMLPSHHSQTWGACDSPKMTDDFPVQVDKRTETLQSNWITVAAAWVARPRFTPEDRRGKFGSINGKNVPSCIASVPTGVRGRKTLLLSLQLTFHFRGGFQEHQNMWRNRLRGLGFGQSDCGCCSWPVHHVFLS